jgi:hypothetical protein
LAAEPCKTARKRATKNISFTFFLFFIKFLKKAISHLTNVPLILTLESFHHAEPHLLINLHIGLILRALQIALDTLVVGAVSDNLKQLTANAFSLRVRSHGHDIAKVISALLVRPQLRLRFALSRFPDPVAFRDEASMTQIAEICE